MKASFFQSPWIAGLLAGGVGAACSWVCARLFFEDAGGGARLGEVIVVACLVGFGAAIGVRRKETKNSQLGGVIQLSDLLKVVLQFKSNTQTGRPAMGKRPDNGL